MLHGTLTKRERERERERDNVFGPTDLSPQLPEEFTEIFFFQRNLCSHLNNSSVPVGIVRVNGERFC